jgi:hypothetical protein
MIPSMAEVYMGSPVAAGMGTIAHELAHVLIGNADMYFDFPYPYAAGSLDLMDSGNYRIPPTHMNPIAKLKYGWLRPKIIFRSGAYALDDIETDHVAWILMDPQRGTDEFFVVENRWPGNSSDQGMQDEGLAVWHFIADFQQYNDPIYKPRDVGDYDVNENGVDDWTEITAWGRGAIRMIRSTRRPVSSGFTIDDQAAMWDGADSTGATSYDLLSQDPDIAHAELRWADGTPSGFRILNISPAGPQMMAVVEVPWCW